MLDQIKTLNDEFIACALASFFPNHSVRHQNRMKDALMKCVYAVGGMGHVTHSGLVVSLLLEDRIIFFPPLESCVQQQTAFTPFLLPRTKDAIFTTARRKRVIIQMQPHYHMTIRWLHPLCCPSCSEANQITTSHPSYECGYLKHFMVQLSGSGFILLPDLRSVLSVVEAPDPVSCNLNR